MKKILSIIKNFFANWMKSFEDIYEWYDLM